jgi:hypothetical protein
MPQTFGSGAEWAVDLRTGLRPGTISSSNEAAACCPIASDAIGASAVAGGSLPKALSNREGIFAAYSGGPNAPGAAPAGSTGIAMGTGIIAEAAPGIGDANGAEYPIGIPMGAAIGCAAGIAA